MCGVYSDAFRPFVVVVSSSSWQNHNFNYGIDLVYDRLFLSDISCKEGQRTTAAIAIDLLISVLSITMSCFVYCSRQYSSSTYPYVHAAFDDNGNQLCYYEQQPKEYQEFG